MPDTLSISRLDLSFARLPSALDGTRILHLSDLHLRRSPGHLEEEVLDVVNGDPPDVLVFTGDTVNSRSVWPEARQWLSRIDVDCPKIAVPGNWEYHRNTTFAMFKDELSSAGFHVLRNQHVVHGAEGAPLAFVGLDDPREGAPDWEGATRNLQSGIFSVAMCHSPDILLSLDGPLFDLMLCGHTHGGQFRLPRLGALYTSTLIGRKYQAGLYEIAGQRYVYVNRGLGTTGIHFRFNCPPELAWITLHHIEERNPEA